MIKMSRMAAVTARSARSRDGNEGWTAITAPKNRTRALRGTHAVRQVVYISSTLGSMVSADTTTVRVRRPDSERLQSLAKARNTPVIDVLHAAIDALERQEFLRGLNEDYQALRNDPERWAEYMSERRSWDDLA